MIQLGPAKPLTLGECARVALQSERVSLSKSVAAMLDERREQIVRFVHKQKHPAYGFNRGFGHNAALAVPDSELESLQNNLIRSHASAVGPLAPHSVVRLAMLLRAQSLAEGHSGVRSIVLQQLVSFLNADIVPEVPIYGSVGASGDLAPLSHIALALIGEGRVYYRGKLVGAMQAIKAAKLTPLHLQMKEGLALNNGLQFSTAYAVLTAIACRTMLKSAVLNTALACQVFNGRYEPFIEELHALRPHPGAVHVATWLRKLLPSAKPVSKLERVQDPYSLRCSAQVLGAASDLIEEAVKTFEIEINSVTDNPLLLADSKKPSEFTRVVSGGHFHGMPVAVKIYNLVQAMCILAQYSNTRCARFVDEARNSGLGNDLIWPGLSPSARASSSGMMVTEYVSAALTNVLWGAAMPTHLFSISTDAGQEDHVSMSAGLAVRAYEMLPRLAEALAVELALCAQAAQIRKHQSKGRFKMSAVCETTLTKVSKVFPAVLTDRSLSAELKILADMVAAGDLLQSIAFKE